MAHIFLIILSKYDYLLKTAIYNLLAVLFLAYIILLECAKSKLNS